MNRYFLKEYFSPAQEQFVDQLRLQLDEFVPFSSCNDFQNVSEKIKMKKMFQQLIKIHTFQ
jgi:hypothetical protein